MGKEGGVGKGCWSWGEAGEGDAGRKVQFWRESGRGGSVVGVRAWRSEVREGGLWMGMGRRGSKWTCGWRRLKDKEAGRVDVGEGSGEVVRRGCR